MSFCRSIDKNKPKTKTKCDKKALKFLNFQLDLDKRKKSSFFCDFAVSFITDQIPLHNKPLVIDNLTLHIRFYLISFLLNIRACNYAKTGREEEEIGVNVIN